MDNIQEVKISQNAQNKREAVEEITEKIKNAQSVIVLSSSGVSVAEITALRKKFREAGVEYKILKNTLVRRALEDLGIFSLDDVLNGPSAFAFGLTDPVAPAKVISDYMAEQKLNNKFVIKAGLVEGTYMDPDAVKALAKLPSKEVLIAKVMGSLNAPITNFVGVLSATLRSLVYAVDAVRQQKEAE
ncbi:MAG: 50S ribosomal protein L10 [Clostridiales bacterium]|nr:50S ribosomal protein L10 [Clostridiales bacterium]